MIEIIELVQVDLLQTTDNHLFELNNARREWERERYDLYLINYISTKNHWLWQRRVPVNWVSKSFSTNSTRNSIYRWPWEPCTHIFVTQLFVKLRVRMFPSTLQAWLPKCFSMECCLTITNMIGTVVFEPLEFPWTGEDNVQKTILWIKQEKTSHHFNFLRAITLFIMWNI
jgi:hypothetical protein